MVITLSFTTGQLKKDVDIVFALGASDPNGARVFEQEKALANHLVGQQKAILSRYGVITYSNISTIQIRLQSSSDIFKIQDQIRNLKWPGIGSGVDTALRQANTVFKDSTPASRKVLVIFMSGMASAPSSTLRETVRPLLKQGVRVVLVGYGDRLDDGQLRGISENGKNIIIPSGDKHDDGYKISLAVFKGGISGLCTNRNKNITCTSFRWIIFLLPFQQYSVSHINFKPLHSVKYPTGYSLTLPIICFYRPMLNSKMSPRSFL